MNISVTGKLEVSLGKFTISVCSDKIYIKHNKLNKVIYITREDFAISEVTNFDEVLNMKPHNNYQVDSIIGIFNYDKDNKYLFFVSKSIMAAKFKGAYIYNIAGVSFLKINFSQENEEENRRIIDLKNFLSSKNFYYSNDYDISKSLYTQEKEIDNNNYLINLLLRKDFVTNNIPKCFLSYVIFGFIGCKIDIEINDSPTTANKKMDIIIIERTHREYLHFREDIARKLREIEFISVYKSDQTEDYIFSTVVYLCNEIFYQNINSVFNPYHSFIKKELDNYEKIICVLNDIYLKSNIPLTDFILNSEDLKKKVILINKIQKDWKPGLYFESNNNCTDYVTSYFENIKNLQENVIWFVDMNNNMVNTNYMNEKCLKAIVRIFWIAMQKQMINLKWNINIGLFSEDNKTNLSLKYKDIIMPYFNDSATKKVLHKPEIRNSAQNIYDFCFNGNEYNPKNSNRLSILKSKNFGISNSSTSGNNSEKLKILCISWNVDDFPVENNNNSLDLKDLLTQNILIQEKILPDIVFVSLQKTVKLGNDNPNIPIEIHKKRILSWYNIIKNNIQNIYSNCVYIPLKCVDFLGNCFISFIKYDLKTKIQLMDSKIIKSGIEPGNKGDKGFISLTFKYNGNYLSIASAYFNSNIFNNNYRLKLLKQLLNTKINVGMNGEFAFKESQYWIILGDLNFRVELDYDPVIGLISKNNSHDILNNDQFYKSKHIDSDFNLICEGDIMFNPTYKFIKESNNYHNLKKNNKTPSYTDRVFHGNNKGINNLYYDSINNIKYSSHKPIVAAFEISVDKK